MIEEWTYPMFHKCNIVLFSYSLNTINIILKLYAYKRNKNNFSRWRKIFILINNVVIITYQLPMVFLPIKFIYNINNAMWTRKRKKEAMEKGKIIIKMKDEKKYEETQRKNQNDRWKKKYDGRRERDGKCWISTGKYEKNSQYFSYILSWLLDAVIVVMFSSFDSSHHCFAHRNFLKI